MVTQKVWENAYFYLCRVMKNFHHFTLTTLSWTIIITIIIIVNKYLGKINVSLYMHVKYRQKGFNAFISYWRDCSVLYSISLKLELPLECVKWVLWYQFSPGLPPTYILPGCLLSSSVEEELRPERTTLLAGLYH